MHNITEISSTEEQYLSFLNDKFAKGEVWISNPLSIINSDLKAELIYYPFYNFTINPT